MLNRGASPASRGLSSSRSYLRKKSLFSKHEVLDPILSETDGKRVAEVMECEVKENRGCRDGCSAQTLVEDTVDM